MPNLLEGLTTGAETRVRIPLGIRTRVREEGTERKKDVGGRRFPAAQIGLLRYSEWSRLGLINDPIS